MQERLVQRSSIFSFILSLILFLFASLGLLTAGSAWAAAPTAPTNLTATVVSSRQINLAWQDKATTETNYYVERSLNGSSSWTVIATLGANVVSYQSTTLTQNTTYYYRVRCKAGTTYSSYSNTANAKTATLAAPTGLTTSVVSAASISLGWTDNTAYETQYSIERSPNGTSSWVVLGTVASNVTTTTNSGLTAGTAYYYRVRAYDSTNYSAYTTTVNQTIRTIAASAGTNGVIAPSGTVGVANASTKVFSMTPNSGYKIATVTVDGSAAATNPTYTFTNVTANHTIAATFSVNTVSYTITASAGANGNISPAGAYSVSSGGTATFTVTPNPNYHVADVVVDGTSKGLISSFTFTNVTANHTIVASFAINTFTITPSVTGSGSITPSTQQIVSYGSGTIFTLKPNAGYYLSGLQVDGSAVATTNTFTFTNVTANHTFAATFSVNTFTITASAGANGTISPSGSVVVSQGTSTTFVITPNAGYKIASITVDGSAVATTPTYTFTNVTVNHTIAATFSVNGYTISASAGANGSISPSGSVVVSDGTSTTFTITPNANYHINDVLVDGVSIGRASSVPFTNVTADHSISASFASDTIISAQTITSSRTWTLAGSPYIITGDVYVYGASSPTLTIDPGVVVKFNQGTTLRIGGNSSSYPGSLYAPGTTSAPILFTSNQTTPIAGYWGGIFFEAGTVSANTTLSHVTVEYGGFPIWYGYNYISSNLHIKFASPKIMNSTIRQSSGYGIYVTSSPIIQDNIITNNVNHGIFNTSAAATSSIAGNIITNNGGYGIYDEYGTATLISGNTISGSGSYPLRLGVLQTGNTNTFGTNGSNAIEVIGGTSNTIKQNLTMKNNGPPYIIMQDIIVGHTSNPKLTIEPGVMLKFINGTGLSISISTASPGALYAAGTTTAPIIFTSNDPAPAPGKWKGIAFNSSIGEYSVLDHAFVEFGGQGEGGLYTYANLMITSCSPVIMNSSIKNSAGSGVYMTGALSTPVIVNSDISSNKWGVSAYNSNPYVLFNNIHGNTTMGVRNDSTSPEVDARENWWGVASGPTYTAGNAGGRGDGITDHVLYNPWLGQAVGSNLSITEVRAMPNALNQNGGYITFTALLSSSATWTITISDGNRNAVNAYIGSGTTIKQKWYGVNSQSIKVSNGPYYYRIEAQDSTTGTFASSPEGLLMVSDLVPIVYVDSPTDNEMIAGGPAISITGRVSDSVDFKNYTLDYGVGGNPTSWINLKPATTTQVMDDLIYAWNTTVFTNGLYTLRLTATDNANNVVVDTIRVRLLWIQNAAITQSYISPYSDGIQKTTTFSATLSYPSVWTITLTDSSNTLVKTFTGTGTTLSQVWDATNEAGAIVPDGIYTYRISATSSETGIQATPKTGLITVDATIPTALIASPGANNVLWDAVLIIGSAFDTNISTYKVEFGPSTGAGPWTTINSSLSSVSSGSLATWVTNDPGLPSPIPNGNYIIRLSVTDRAGNSAVTAVPVTIDDLQLTNVGISTTSINTLAAESTSIYFTVNTPATATLKIIPELLGPTGAPVHQTSKTCTVAGPDSFIWNGQDNTGKTVPDEAYIYILEASDGIKTYTYDPPVPTGTGTISCSKSSFDPVRNIPMTVTYTPTQPSRVNIVISWSVINYTFLNAFPVTPTTHTYDWDGRNPSNDLLDTDAYSSCSVSSLLPVNFIITTGDTVKVTNLKTDPYAQQISYGQFTRITYTLSRDAYVTVKLTSPSGSIFTLVSNQLQTAGSQALNPWNGLDATDMAGKKTIINEEGDYMVSVQAVNPVTGTSSTTRANLRIGY